MKTIDWNKAMDEACKQFEWEMTGTIKPRWTGIDSILKAIKSITRIYKTMKPAIEDCMEPIKELKEIIL